jgi:hypothetical protein
MDGRRLGGLLESASRRWPRLGFHARVLTASALVVGGLVVPGLVSGSWPGHESEAGAVVVQAQAPVAVAAVGIPSGGSAGPAATTTPTTATATTVAPAVATTTTFPWVVMIDPSSTTSTTQPFALPPGAVLSTAQAQDLIRSRFPRGEWDNALAVAECESRFQALAVNVNTNGTRDLGLFQINDGGTLQELGGDEGLAFDPVWNVDAAYRLWRSYGWIRWTCAFRVGILDPALTSTSGSSTTTVTTRPAARASSSTSFNWPLASTTGPAPATTAPPTTAAPTTVPPTTAAPTTVAPTTAAPTTVPVTTSATTPLSGSPPT